MSDPSDNDAPDVLPDGRLRLDADVETPDLLDVLVAGGGPAGTAVAFRARELGLSALVIELDDILKRIRDYDSAKPIKPDFGAGKQMGFPRGGPLIERLQFHTDIRGEDLCAAWKALYRRHNVPAQIGVELLGLEPDGGGAWRALVRNHRRERDDVLRARHVVLALGAGMPRRLDVPGDVRAIRNRLSHVGSFVGAAACVLGGGVAAAEAVIAISEAKAAAGDETAVYWSCRGKKMPQVPRALQAAMARAVAAAANVRLLPGSEAQEVADVDGRAVLRLRIDPSAGGPSGAEVDWSTLAPADGGSSDATGDWYPGMVFDASRVIACIGQEIDWRLMDDVGIFPVSGGAQVRKAIPLNALFECRQPNVYVIGDTLNPSYLECEDFDGDASAFRKVAHRGNIKAALIDGVKVANVIGQRLSGEPEIRIDLQVAGGEPTPPPSIAGRRPAVLTRLLDGAVEAEQFALHADRGTTIGRRGSDICFADDGGLADRHAVVVPDRDGYRVRDESSSAGVFLHLADGRERVVAPGTVARLGRQWLVFGLPDNRRTVAHHTARGRLVRKYELAEGTHVFGRAAPDVTLAPGDGSLSRRHLSVVVVGPGMFVRDLNCVNGTYLKVDGAWALADGDVVRVGRQALRFQFLTAETGVASRTVDTRSSLRPAPSPAAGGGDGDVPEPQRLLSVPVGPDPLRRRRGERRGADGRLSRRHLRQRPGPHRRGRGASEPDERGGAGDARGPLRGGPRHASARVHGAADRCRRRRDRRRVNRSGPPVDEIPEPLASQRRHAGPAHEEHALLGGHGAPQGCFGRGQLADCQQGERGEVGHGPGGHARAVGQLHAVELPQGAIPVLQPDVRDGQVQPGRRFRERGRRGLDRILQVRQQQVRQAARIGDRDEVEGLGHLCGDRPGLRLPANPEPQLGAGPLPREQSGHVAGRGHGRAVHTDHDVAHRQLGALAGAARGRADDRRTLDVGDVDQRDPRERRTRDRRGARAEHAEGDGQRAEVGQPQSERLRCAAPAREHRQRELGAGATPGRRRPQDALRVERVREPLSRRAPLGDAAGLVRHDRDQLVRAGDRGELRRPGGHHEHAPRVLKGRLDPRQRACVAPGRRPGRQQDEGPPELGAEHRRVSGPPHAAVDEPPAPRADLDLPLPGADVVQPHGRAAAQASVDVHRRAGARRHDVRRRHRGLELDDAEVGVHGRIGDVERERLPRRAGPLQPQPVLPGQQVGDQDRRRRTAGRKPRHGLAGVLAVHAHAHAGGIGRDDHRAEDALEPGCRGRSPRPAR